MSESIIIAQAAGKDLKDFKELRFDLFNWDLGGGKIHNDGDLFLDMFSNSRINVDAFNRADGIDSLFSIGHNCVMVSDALPKGHPQVAQVAIQQARNLGRNFKLLLQKKEMVPFRYKNLG